MTCLIVDIRHSHLFQLMTELTAFRSCTPSSHWKNSINRNVNNDVIYPMRTSVRQPYHHPASVSIPVERECRKRSVSQAQHTHINVQLHLSTHTSSKAISHRGTGFGWYWLCRTIRVILMSVPSWLFDWSNTPTRTPYRCGRPVLP